MDFEFRLDLDGFEGDFLEGKLLAGLLEQAERKRVGLVAGAELDFDRLASELREGLGHFAVEDEGGVGVKFFLELVQLSLVAIPRAAFIHREHKEVAAFIVGEGVEYAGMREAHRAGGGVGRVHGLYTAFGNHW